ncbi:hypothetical protein NK983_27850, partial [Salmonella enterica subsp. enterica serovar Typhimurium]|nr:hypothetical protein [Salmonella enterica subsp. enterica serovar Typhimurium]
VIQAENKFIAYFQSHPTESSKQKKMFKRWLVDAKQSIDDNGFYVPFSTTASNSALSVATSSVTRTWKMIGPHYAQRTKCNTQSELSGGFCDR